MPMRAVSAVMPTGWRRASCGLRSCCSWESKRQWQHPTLCIWERVCCYYHLHRATIHFTLLTVWGLQLPLCTQKCSKSGDDIIWYMHLKAAWRCLSVQGLYRGQFISWWHALGRFIWSRSRLCRAVPLLHRVHLNRVHTCQYCTLPPNLLPPSFI